MAPPPSSSDRWTNSGERQQGNDTLNPPWMSADADSSNPETLHEIPSGDYQPRASTSSKVPRASMDSANPRSPTAQRLAELRAEMKANQDQIQQLTAAHQAVQNAVSGITATQELLKVHPQPEAVAGENLQRMASTRTTGSKYSEIKGMTEYPEQPITQPHGIDRQGWVDDDYYNDNPWYGKPRDKPVFSLGRPLPHKSRFRRKKVSRKGNKDKQQQQAAGEDRDVEKGQGGVESKPSKKEKRVQIADGEGDQMMTRNSQQVDSPWDVDFRVPDLTGQGDGAKEETKASGYEDGSKYKVDGEPLGQREDDEAADPDKDPDDLRNWWARLRNKYPEPLAEFAATGMSVFLGICATLSVNLSEGEYGTYETSCWAWGFSFMFGIYLGGGISGAHMNPAISICLSIFRGFPWRQCGMYIVTQFVASMTAAALAYGIYYDAIHRVDPTMTETYTNFFSYPQEWVTNITAAFSQFVAGAIMMIAVMSLGDDQNNPPGAGMHAFILGLLQATLKFTLGYNTGSALNPASDFGPRVVALAVGYRSPKIFRNAWWIYGPWAAALAGSIAGCIFYDMFIFVGSESPVNYRIPRAFRKRTQKLKDIKRKF
ncbi:aquaporin-like protein [Xylariomycetidae sp. FL0641]|nr:aquaporin-like protein [Xylariomycetidae sp. FL0641]